MANTIRIKRRITGSTGAPSSLAVGELAYNEMDNTLYIGTHNNGTPQVVPLAGLGEFVRLSNVNQTINGLKTFSQHPVISETQLGTGENSTKVATTAWVKSLGYTTTGVTNLSFGTITGTDIPLLSSTGTDVTFTPATTSVAGLMSAADKSKLDGIAAGATANTGTVTGVTGTSPVVSSGGTAPAISLASGYGDTQNPYGSKSTNLFLASPNGSSGVPTFRAMAEADVPSLTASKISNFDTQVRTNRLDQMAAPTASVGLNNQKITGLATPTADTDAANKGYVDSVVQGLHPKQAVRAATTANITSLSGTLTIDGVSLVVGDRVLVKNQTTASQNGIYVVASGSWTRSLDADIWDELISAYVFVQEGATNADVGYICTVNTGGTLGTTDVTWAQFTSASQVDAGAGLTQSGTTLNVGGTTDRISVSADAVDIASTYVGQTSITTLGTISTGTWNATTIGVGKGGTGVTTLTTNGILYGGATVGATAAGTWDSTNSIGQLLSHNSSGTPVWTDTIDGGTF